MVVPDGNHFLLLISDISKFGSFLWFLFLEINMVFLILEMTGASNFGSSVCLCLFWVWLFFFAMAVTSAPGVLTDGMVRENSYSSLVNEGPRSFPSVRPPLSKKRIHFYLEGIALKGSLERNPNCAITFFSVGTTTYLWKGR